MTDGIFRHRVHILVRDAIEWRLGHLAHPDRDGWWVVWGSAYGGHKWGASWLESSRLRLVGAQGIDNEPELSFGASPCAACQGAGFLPIQENWPYRRYRPCAECFAQP